MRSEVVSPFKYNEKFVTKFSLSCICVLGNSITVDISLLSQKLQVHKAYLFRNSGLTIQLYFTTNTQRLIHS